jgi:predicted HTH domain antitoxin
MQDVMSVRLDRDVMDFLKNESKEEKIDKAKILRELVDKGRIYLAIEEYKKGEISIGRAAEKAGVNIGTMMDLLAELGIKSNITKELYLQGLKNLKKVW